MESKETVEYKPRLLESFDHFFFHKIGCDLYFQWTKIPCYYESIPTFYEKDLIRVKTHKIPIYRLFDVKDSEDTILYATDYYFIPFEEGTTSIQTWKGYYVPELGQKTEFDSMDFYELFQEGGNRYDVIIEYLYQMSYTFTYYHKDQTEKREVNSLFYTPNVNIGSLNQIDEVYQEYIITQLEKMNIKRQMVEVKTEYSVERYTKNIQDFHLMRELVGDYGLIYNRKYLFKVAEVEYETMMRIS